MQTESTSRPPDGNASGMTPYPADSNNSAQPRDVAADQWPYDTLSYQSLLSSYTSPTFDDEQNQTIDEILASLNIPDSQQEQTINSYKSVQQLCPQVPTTAADYTAIQAPHVSGGYSSSASLHQHPNFPSLLPDGGGSAASTLLPECIGAEMRITSTSATAQEQIIPTMFSGDRGTRGFGYTNNEATMTGEAYPYRAPYCPPALAVANSNGFGNNYIVDGMTNGSFGSNPTTAGPHNGASAQVSLMGSPTECQPPGYTFQHPGIAAPTHASYYAYPQAAATGYDSNGTRSPAPTYPTYPGTFLSSDYTYHYHHHISNAAANVPKPATSAPELLPASKKRKSSSTKGNRKKGHTEVKPTGVDPEKPHGCLQCDARFKLSANLKQHMVIHTGEKPFQCHLCDSSFTRLSSLKTHQRLHTGDKPHVCSFCMMAFADRSAMRAHKRIHTGERPYRCEICLTTFIQLSHLNAHSRTHTGEKPYICHNCETAFKQLGHLRRHEKSHVCKDTMSRRTALAAAAEAEARKGKDCVAKESGSAE